MASTSFSLGKHWESFLNAQVESGRYGTKAEVVREALRLLEVREAAIADIRHSIAEGEKGQRTPLTRETLTAIRDRAVEKVEAERAARMKKSA